VIPLIMAWSRGKCVPRNQQLPATCYYSETYGDLQLLWTSMQQNRRRNCWRSIRVFKDGFRCSKNMQMWHYRMWFSRHGGDALMGGLDDLRGLFQP